MIQANYMPTMGTGTTGNGLYPLSIQTLDLIQEQVMLLQTLANIGGGKYIIPGDNPAVVIKGEIFALQGSREGCNCIQIVTEKIDVTADGTTYKEARTRRYAKYVKYSSGKVQKDGTDGIWNISGFQEVSTNASLESRFRSYNALASELNRKLSVETYSSLTRAALDKEHDRNVRLHCRKGCVKLNGAEEYTINVYRNSDETVTQEQILPDMTRYIRQWNPATKTWSAFHVPAFKESLHLEVKVTSGNRVYVRHGELPPDVRLVLLRKKKRSGKRRTGGDKTTNGAFKGKTRTRQSKNQYCHYKGVILSLGQPNKWYVPKVIAVDAGGNWSNLIGKELSTVCAGFLNINGSVVRARNTRHKATDRGDKSTLYVKMGLQLAVTNNRSKSAGGEMVPMLYRVWWDHRLPRIIHADPLPGTGTGVAKAPAIDGGTAVVQPFIRRMRTAFSVV